MFCMSYVVTVTLLYDDVEVRQYVHEHLMSLKVMWVLSTA